MQATRIGQGSFLSEQPGNINNGARESNVKPPLNLRQGLTAYATVQQGAINQRNQILQKRKLPSSNAYGSQIYKNDKHSSVHNTVTAAESQADGLTENSKVITDYDNEGSPERITGLPNPTLYDQYYVNKYSFPKGLNAIHRDGPKPKYRKSLYDIKTPNLRKGVSGWKLTRRPHEWAPPAQESSQNISQGLKRK